MSLVAAQWNRKVELSSIQNARGAGILDFFVWLIPPCRNGKKSTSASMQVGTNSCARCSGAEPEFGPPVGLIGIQSACSAVVEATPSRARPVLLAPWSMLGSSRQAPVERPIAHLPRSVLRRNRSAQDILPTPPMLAFADCLQTPSPIL